jgi:hypothetical protein
VSGRIVARAVDLDQHEPGRSIGLLDHIKASDAGFLNAVSGVLRRRLLKASVDWVDMAENVLQYTWSPSLNRTA